jgi:hypothetical protein
MEPAGIEPATSGLQICLALIGRGQRMSGGDGCAACDSALGPAWATIVNLI